MHYFIPEKVYRFYYRDFSGNAQPISLINLIENSWADSLQKDYENIEQAEFALAVAMSNCEHFLLKEVFILPVYLRTKGDRTK